LPEQARDQGALAQRHEHVLNPYARDRSVAADNECRRDRQHPGVIALGGGNIDSGRGHHPLHLGADPDREISG
jgi:hypothetical protein